MSQFYINSAGMPTPPAIPTSFVTDDGTAIPAANVLDVVGGSSTDSNDNGIFTEASPDLSNNLVISLSNRMTGTATSVNASVEDLITLALGASPASYRMEFKIAGRDTSTGDALGYTIFVSVKTNGAAASIVATPFIDADENASLTAASATVIASGNNAVLQVTGVASQTIQYKAVGTYVVV